MLSYKQIVIVSQCFNKLFAFLSTIPQTQGFLLVTIFFNSLSMVLLYYLNFSYFTYFILIVMKIYLPPSICTINSASGNMLRHLFRCSWDMYLRVDFLDVLLINCCVTNYPKLRSLNLQTLKKNLRVSLGLESGSR